MTADVGNICGCNHDHALTMFSRAFEKIFRQLYTKQYNEIVLVHRNRRSTGDCLGP